MSLVTSLQQRWVQLQPREKRILVIGAQLILLTLVWAVFQPLLGRRAELGAGLASGQADSAWLQEQGALLARLHNDCLQIRVAPMNASDFIRRQVERNGITLTALQQPSPSVSRLQVTATDGNAVLRLAYQLVCQGQTLQKLEIRHIDSGSFTAELEVSHGS